MEQRDYIQRQIEQIGIVLRAIIGRIMGVGSGNGTETAYVRETLRDELDLDLDLILSSSVSDVVGMLADKGFDGECMLRFRDMLLKLAIRLPENDPIKVRIIALCNGFEEEIGRRSGTVRFEDLM